MNKVSYPRNKVLGGIWGLIITAIFVFVPKPIARIFFHEATAIEIAVDYLMIVGLSEAFMCVELMTVGALSGLGKTHLCSVISIIFTGARIPLAIPALSITVPGRGSACRPIHPVLRSRFHRFCAPAH